MTILHKGITRRHMLAGTGAGALGGRIGRSARRGAGDGAAGLPDQHVGHADLLPAALRPAGEARRQVRGIRGAVRQPHHAADGGAPGRHGHLCRPVLRHRPRQRRPGRHRHDRICRQDRARDGAQGSRHHQGRAAQGPEGRQPDRLVDRQHLRRPDRHQGRPEEGRLPGNPHERERHGGRHGRQDRRRHVQCRALQRHRGSRRPGQ